MPKSPRYNSQGGYFADTLYDEMQKNKDIYLLTGDLGYGVLDDIKRDFPDRFINTGAAEQSLLDIGVGLALSGKIPICYSITSFLLFRGFETIRNYVNYEKIPVILIGRGRDKDYANLGKSHWSNEDKYLMKMWGNIRAFWPQSNEQVSKDLKQALLANQPTYISLVRK